MPPTTGHGKICYLLLPAVDAEASSVFYQKVFGWNIRRRGSGELSFDDGVGEVSGMWLAGHDPVDASFVYIMTDDMERTLSSVAKEGGTVLHGPDPKATEITGVIQDPAGNTFGVYQSPNLERRS